MTVMRLIAEDTFAIITIYQEAQGEPYAGKVAVAEVIRNRMRRHYASDGTISGTVLRPLQFSGWNATDPGRIRSVRIDDADYLVHDCQRAWAEALAGSETVQGAVLYYNPLVIHARPDWASPEHAVEVCRVGAHVFFLPIPLVTTTV